jgi:hypothetical protein
MMAATGIATLVAFHVDGYSIYSARLPAFTDHSAPAAPADNRTYQTVLRVVPMAADQHRWRYYTYLVATR